MSVAGSKVDLDSFKGDLVDEILEDGIETQEEGLGEFRARETSKDKQDVISKIAGSN